MLSNKKKFLAEANKREYLSNGCSLLVNKTGVNDHQKHETSQKTKHSLSNEDVNETGLKTVWIYTTSIF